MKLQYYYDGQFRRVLKHLIRAFGEFQVRSGVDDEGKYKYKTVPCRYADISRLAASIINGNSENVMPTAPMMTIGVQSLKMDRPSIRSPVSETLIMGTNVSPSVNEYTKELDDQVQIVRHNPVPWKLTFDLNIWTTTLESKMELFEQISTLFAPSIQLQLSENPVDWTSLSDVELMDCQFTTRGVTQGTDQELDIMVMTFETTIWFSLPAKVTKPKLIHEIATNIKGARDELEIDLGSGSDLITDVFTPKNLCLLVDKVTSTTSADTYQLTLVSSSFDPQGPKGGIFSWQQYLKYFDPKFLEKDVHIKFQQAIEEENPLRGYVISYGTGADENKIVVQVDNSEYKVEYTITGFIEKANELNNAIPEQYYVNLAVFDIQYKETKIPSNAMFKITNGGAELFEPNSVKGYVYNTSDEHFYRYNDKFGWHRSIMNRYRQGFWRIAFRDR